MVKRPLLSFDLDDTLFPCSTVVARSNAKLVSALTANGVSAAARIDAPAIQAQIKLERRKSATVLTYSEMRTRAIRSILQLHGGHGDCHATDDLAHELFDIWLEERNRAANDLLFEGAVDAIQACKSAHPDAIIGAISNGRGDPLCMPRLEHLFDFTVSGEDPDVFPDRKPSPGIYEAALRRAASTQGGGTPPEEWRTISRGWVHVGDCLVNDVSASKAAGARTIWLQSSETMSAERDQFVFSTASEQEVEERKKRGANAMQHIDATIASLRSLPAAVDELAATL